MSDSKYLYTDAILKKDISRTPIWIMRQAGRYLPEYRKLRDTYDFLTVCKTPELATEVTLQPIRRFGFDAAILFSDILVIPEALGQKLEFLDDHGPKLSPQILTLKSLSDLPNDELEQKLDYVAAAIRMIRRELPQEIPLIGFSGSPFTLATYMIEGKPTKNFKYIKTMMYKEPQLLKTLLEKLTGAVVRYFKMQIEAGVQAIQIFDTWGGILPVHWYDNFSARYMTKIVQSLQSAKLPVTLFTRGGFSLIQQLRDSGAQMLGVDWLTDLAMVKQNLGEHVALQGNLDPMALFGSREILQKEIDKILDVYMNQSGHVFNLGHGILPETPIDNVQYLVEYVRERSTQLHSNT